MALPLKWRRGTTCYGGLVGPIFQAIDLETGRLYSVEEVSRPSLKLHHPPNANDEGAAVSLEATESAVAFCAALPAHPHVAAVFGSRWAPSKSGSGRVLNVFGELVGAGGGGGGGQAPSTLHALLLGLAPLPETAAAALTRQILDGLRHIHRAGISHGRLSSGNVLVAPGGVLKLAHFWPTVSLGRGGKGGEEEDELLLASRQTRDLWALGAIVLEIFMGVRRAKAHIHRCSRSSSSGGGEGGALIIPPPDDSLTDRVRSFLQRCFSGPAAENTSDALLRHPFVAQGAVPSSERVVDDGATPVAVGKQSGGGGGGLAAFRPPVIDTALGPPALQRRDQSSKRSQREIPQQQRHPSYPKKDAASPGTVREKALAQRAFIAKLSGLTPSSSPSGSPANNHRRSPLAAAAAAAAVARAPPTHTDPRSDSGTSLVDDSLDDLVDAQLSEEDDELEDSVDDSSIMNKRISDQKLLKQRRRVSDVIAALESPDTF